MTLWARRELSLEEVESYMIDWIERERPGVRRWNLDENASRSIQVYHVHIYTQVRHCGEKIDLRDALISFDIFLAGVHRRCLTRKWAPVPLEETQRTWTTIS